MTRRRWIIAGLVVLAVAVAVPILWPRDPRPCRATFEQVRKGMTLAEVVATVGGPPGVYCDHPELAILVSGVDRVPREQWIAHDAHLIADFDQDWVVVSAYIEDPLPDNRSRVQRIRDRLGL